LACTGRSLLADRGLAQPARPAAACAYTRLGSKGPHRRHLPCGSRYPASQAMNDRKSPALHALLSRSSDINRVSALACPLPSMHPCPHCTHLPQQSSALHPQCSCCQPPALKPPVPPHPCTPPYGPRSTPPTGTRRCSSAPARSAGTPWAAAGPTRCRQTAPRSPGCSSPRGWV
jgi:hypothetical protein